MFRSLIKSVFLLVLFVCTSQANAQESIRIENGVLKSYTLPAPNWEHSIPADISEQCALKAERQKPNRILCEPGSQRKKYEHVDYQLWGVYTTRADQEQTFVTFTDTQGFEVSQKIKTFEPEWNDFLSIVIYVLSFSLICFYAFNPPRIYLKQVGIFMGTVLFVALVGSGGAQLELSHFVVTIAGIIIGMLTGAIAALAYGTTPRDIIGLLCGAIIFCFVSGISCGFVGDMGLTESDFVGLMTILIIQSCFGLGLSLAIHRKRAVPQCA